MPQSTKRTASKSKKNLISEVIPQSDQFTYGIHPRLQTHLYGHHKAAEKICHLFNQNKAPHGMIFVGKQGIGKATFIYHLIRALERKGNSITPDDIYHTQNDDVYRKIEMLSNGNLKILRRQFNVKTGKHYQSIRMEEIRNLRPFFEMKSHSDGKRYIVIDSLDDCIHGQNSVPNALLKTLEEPPENCYFFIIAHKEGLILPTIKSRCMMINMVSPNQEDLSSIINNMPHLSSKITPEALKKAIEMADGSVRLALIYADKFWFNLLTQIKKALFKSLPAKQVLPTQALKDKSYDNIFSYSEYLNILHLLCSRAISDNAKFASQHNNYAAAYASGIIFEKMHTLFTKADEYNFTISEVIEQIINILDYYHFIKSKANYGS